MRLGLARWGSVVGRVAVGVLVVLAGLGVMSGVAGAQGVERIVTASATCVGATDERKPFIWVNVFNRSGAPIRLIAVDGFSSSQAFDPFFLEEPLDGLLDLEILDGEGVAVDTRWSGLIGGDGEGLAAGAMVVTSVGALTPTCGDRSQDAGRLVVDDPIPATDQDRQLQEARSMAETLGRLEGWRAYPLLHALLHPDVRDALDLGQLTCWYVGEYGGRLDPDHLDIFTTTVSVAEIEPWAWEVTGKEYETAIAYDYTQEVGTLREQETVSASAHLVREDGVWRWFFGTSQTGLEALPGTCRDV